ncbi:Uncharacterised protein [Shewanella putrefaciens]|uniref:hypothetical protein n=1 Tax=Shewanella putrefaciens TaxID=24 RepID=UPI000DFEC818|nr:hypothetical protein [Shewanella putrefaciens]SUI79019.1 Uncharacterised protein [Shewanella putrefaciens]
MDVGQFKLSKKFMMIMLFSLVAFGLYSSLDLVVRVGDFNSIMELSRPLDTRPEKHTENLEVLKARIQLLETQLEAQSSYQTMTQKIESRVWILYAIFQFMFILLIYNFFISKEKLSNSNVT